MVAPEGFEVLATGKERVEGQLLRDPSEVGASGGGTDGVTEDANAPGVGTNTPHDAADERGFASAVWTEKAEAGARKDFEGDSGDRSYCAEALSDVVDRQRRRRGRHVRHAESEWATLLTMIRTFIRMGYDILQGEQVLQLRQVSFSKRVPAIFELNRRKLWTSPRTTPR